jgi:hypothetical protein
VSAKIGTERPARCSVDQNGGVVRLAVKSIFAARKEYGRMVEFAINASINSTTGDKKLVTSIVYREFGPKSVQ